MEETIRKLEKMIENLSRADKIVYTRGNIEDAIEWINRLKDRIKQLEKENKYRRNEVKKLKKELKAKKELLRYYQKKKNKFTLQSSKWIQQ